MSEMGFDSNVSPPKRLSSRKRGSFYERKRWVKSGGRYELRQRVWSNGNRFGSKAGYKDVKLDSESFLSHSAKRRRNVDVSKALIFLFAILLMFSFLSSSFMVETRSQMGEGTYLQRYGFASKFDGGYYWEFDGSRLMEKLGQLKTENLFESFMAFELSYIDRDSVDSIDTAVGESIFAVCSAILNVVIFVFNVVKSILDIIIFFVQELVTVIEILIIIIKEGFVYMEPVKVPVGG